VTRLTKQWGEDHAAFQARDLSDRDFVHVWAAGVHPKVRLGQAHPCVLVLLGVRAVRKPQRPDAPRGAAGEWKGSCRKRGHLLESPPWTPTWKPHA
jgi:hypothetical protein